MMVWHTTRHGRRGRAACLLALLVPAGIALTSAAAQQVLPQMQVQAHLPLQISEHDLPDAFAGLPFGTSMAINGGSGSYSILITGQVPPGLKFLRGPNAVGLVGIATVPGSYQFQVNVTDLIGGGSVSHTYDLNVTAARVTADGSPAMLSTSDAETFTVTDTPDVFFPLKINDAETFNVTDTNDIYFPLKVTDAETFTVSDVPDVFFPDRQSDAEGFHFGDTETVTLSAMVSEPESFTVSDSDAVTLKVGLSPTSIPAGTYNTAYSAQFNPVGYTGTLTITESGTLPGGITFKHVLNQVYVLVSGTPTATGTFPFTLTVTDSGTGGTSTIPYTLVISPASQSITLGTIPSVSYSAGNFALSATASSGLAVTITPTNALVTGTGPFVPAGAGMATFQATQSGNSDYAAATPVNFSVTISPATLTVTAAAASRVFDQPNPAFTASYSGFVHGDTTSVLSGAPSITTTATPISPLSGAPYAIVPGTGTLTAANYTFGFVNGSLTLSKAAQAITFYPLPNLAHGTTFPLSARASSGLPVTYSVTGPASIANNILSVTGTGTVQVTAAQAGNGNYNAATSVVRSFTAQ